MGSWHHALKARTRCRRTPRHGPSGAWARPTPNRYRRTPRHRPSGARGRSSARRFWPAGNRTTLPTCAGPTCGLGAEAQHQRSIMPRSSAIPINPDGGPEPGSKSRVGRGHVPDERRTIQSPETDSHHPMLKARTRCRRTSRHGPSGAWARPTPNRYRRTPRHRPSGARDRSSARRFWPAGNRTTPPTCGLGAEAQHQRSIMPRSSAIPINPYGGPDLRVPYLS